MGPQGLLQVSLCPAHLLCQMSSPVAGWEGVLHALGFGFTPSLHVSSQRQPACSQSFWLQGLSLAWWCLGPVCSKTVCLLVAWLPVVQRALAMGVLVSCPQPVSLVLSAAPSSSRQPLLLLLLCLLYKILFTACCFLSLLFRSLYVLLLASLAYLWWCLWLRCRWTTRRRLFGCRSSGTDGQTRSVTALPTSVTPSSSTPMNTLAIPLGLWSLRWLTGRSPGTAGLRHAVRHSCQTWMGLDLTPMSLLFFLHVPVIWWQSFNSHLICDLMVVPARVSVPQLLGWDYLTD